MIGVHVHPDGHAVALTGAAWLPAGLLAVTLVGAYLLLVGRRRRVMGRRWSHWRTASWALGALLVAAALAPPVAALAHTDPRGHMAQHLLLGMYAPLALVMAAPITLLLGAAPAPARRWIGAVLGSTVAHVLSHPLIAGVINVGSLYLLYLTGLYAATTTVPQLHTLLNLHFVLAGALFTWSVAGPDPAPRRPGTSMRVAALLLTAAAHAFLAKWLYAQAASLPPGAGHTAAAMEQAARWMYYGGDVAELLLATALFTAWYRARQPARQAPKTLSHSLCDDSAESTTPRCRRRRQSPSRTL
jgi:putative membrane protein